MNWLDRFRRTPPPADDGRHSTDPPSSRRPHRAADQPGWILQPDQVLVGNYRIEHMIGSPGGMGQVFAAEEIISGTRVAIKVPSLNILQAPKGGERFLREARIAERLGPHPHIVRIRGCLVDPELKLHIAASRESIPIPFIVMEFLGGGDLAALLRRRPMNLQFAGRLFGDIASALRCAHHHVHESGGKKLRGVVHRDLKPENVCFDDTGRLVVVDFGIARMLGDLSSTLGAAGTPAYMAPEQWNPVKGVDHRTDMYALAIMLFQMITGALPFSGTVEDLMAAHLLKAPPDPREWRAEVPEGIATAIRRALQKEKEARFPGVEEFAAAVGAALKPPRASAARPPDDKQTSVPSPNSEPREVRTLEVCASCETPGVPDMLVGKLYCPNCGSLWAPAIKPAAKGQAAQTGPPDPARAVSSAASRDAAIPGTCAHCAQSGLPDTVSGKQYCASCGAAWEPINARTPATSKGTQTAPNSWICPNGHTGQPSMVAGVAYCEECGVPLQKTKEAAPAPAYSWVSPESKGEIDKACPACGSTKAPAMLSTGAYCNDCGARFSV